MNLSEADYIPERGDIVKINFSPQKGHEQGFFRPAIVLTPLGYNQRTSLALLCPITNQVKGYPFEVPLAVGMVTTGVVLADQVKSLDWKARKARFVESASSELIAEVLALIEALLLI